VAILPTLWQPRSIDLDQRLGSGQLTKRRKLLPRLREEDMKERRVILRAGPHHVTLEMTTRCNLNCAHCRRFNVHEEGSETRGVFGEEVVEDLVGGSGYMDDAVFERSLDLVRDTEWVSLTGYGEPMLHPRYFDFAARLKERGHTLDSISNGTLLNDANVQKLVDHRFDLLSVSIDGLEDRTLRTIRGVSADVVFGGLERLAKAKRAAGLGRDDAPRISINFAMGRMNIREMPALARKLAEYDVHVFYAHILETASWKDGLAPQLIYTDPKVREEAAQIVEQTKAICTQLGINTDFRPIPHNGMGDEMAGVDLDSAFEVFERAVTERGSEKRVYKPLAAIDMERRRMAERAKARLAHGDGPKGGGCNGGGCSPFAGPDRLSAQEKLENERCLDFFRYAFVTWSGKVISCCFERFGCGDLNLQTAEEVWNGSDYQKLRRGYWEDGMRWVCHGCSRILD